MLTPVNAQTVSHITGVEVALCSLTIPGGDHIRVIIYRSLRTPVETVVQTPCCWSHKGHMLQQ